MVSKRQNVGVRPGKCIVRLRCSGKRALEKLLENLEEMCPDEQPVKFSFTALPGGEHKQCRCLGKVPGRPAPGSAVFTPC